MFKASILLLAIAGCVFAAMSEHNMCRLFEAPSYDNPSKQALFSLESLIGQKFVIDTKELAVTDFPWFYEFEVCSHLPHACKGDTEMPDVCKGTHCCSVCQRDKNVNTTNCMGIFTEDKATTITTAVVDGEKVLTIKYTNGEYCESCPGDKSTTTIHITCDPTVEHVLRPHFQYEGFKRGRPVFDFRHKSACELKKAPKEAITITSFEKPDCQGESRQTYFVDDVNMCQSHRTGWNGEMQYRTIYCHNGHLISTICKDDKCQQCEEVLDVPSPRTCATNFFGLGHTFRYQCPKVSSSNSSPLKTGLILLALVVIVVFVVKRYCFATHKHGPQCKHGPSHSKAHHHV